MKKQIVRLQKIEIINLKNIGKGNIQFSCNMNSDIFADGSDILGVYGQNGSGKTTLVDALMVFRALARGNRMGKDILNYIKYGTDHARCSIEFSILDEEQKFKVIYEFEIQLDESKADDHEETDISAYVSAEKIIVAKFIHGKWGKMIPMINYHAQQQQVTPKIRLAELIAGNKNHGYDLRVAMLLAKKDGASFLFCKEFKRIMRSSALADDDRRIIDMLSNFAHEHLEIISNAQSSMNQLYGRMSLDEVSKVKKSHFSAFAGNIKKINIVLTEIIPGLSIELKEIGIELNKKNEEVILAQMIARRGKTQFPLKYESDGIKKIIGILNGLIMVMNNPSVTLVVDELDAGVFEFLLGEILKIIGHYGQGQLIFTSHNLRPLEVLDKKSIIFTTVNENNRYIRFKNVKANNNLRDVYFHDIVLGGQKEEIYEATDPYTIRRAFRLAGDQYGC